MFRAADRLHPKSLILCGGVARNKKLRAEFEKRAASGRLDFYIPSPKLCTDNAAMVGGLALAKLGSKITPAFSLDLDAYPRSRPNPSPE
jgi:N6-L-threonylcarbamoyladenine synthase